MIETLANPETEAPAIHVDATSEQGIPAEAALVMSALEAGKPGEPDRRRESRQQFRAPAALRLFSDPAGTMPALLYTRDISRKGLGFISPVRLPLGYGGLIQIHGPDKKFAAIHCTLLRCREAAPGWFEGTLYFNREQPQFEPAAPRE